MLKDDKVLQLKEILLNGSIKSNLGFEEADILPLFDKYLCKKKIALNLLSLFRYIATLPIKIFFMDKKG
ncbi:hypothetical protein [Myxosarcina sp. GI1]|uniref:hypothetical protein n=1 Tax=Myxosarcina sp. GI1 TaxID=1541065 RepID=UPI00055E9C3C|nr:hypothetical protein [Myxosarcina sp. GI1]